MLNLNANINSQNLFNSKIKTLHTDKLVTNNRDLGERDKMNVIYNKLMDVSWSMGDLIGMKKETVAARMELSQKGLLEEMSHDYINYSILLKKNLKPCKAIVEGLQ